MSTVQTTYEKSDKLSLKQMENRINSDEGWGLELQLLGSTDTQSLCTFERRTAVPANKVKLKLASDAPDGKLICKGKIWIAEKKTEVAAYR